MKMKVNKSGMLIKFAAFYLCISFIVVSAIPLDDSQNVDKQSASVEVTESEDYDVAPSEKPIEEEKPDDVTDPPQVFPEDDGKSTLKKNETALEILLKNSTTSVKNDENSSAKGSINGTSTNDDKDYDEKVKESEDKPKTEENLPKEKNQKATNDEEKQQTETSDKKDEKKEEDLKDKDYENESEETSGDDKQDTENIQENQDQGDLEEKYGVNSTSINVFEEPTLKGGHIAFIFASLLVFLSATAYVGLVLWRKSLEYRYGMRQRLVTEDDYYNNNDVRFFGL